MPTTHSARWTGDGAALRKQVCETGNGTTSPYAKVVCPNHFLQVRTDVLLSGKARKMLPIWLLQPVAMKPPISVMAHAID